MAGRERQPRRLDREEGLERLLRRRRQRRAAAEVTPAREDRVPIVSLATRVGAIALVAGASAAEATQMILRIGIAREVPLHVDVTFTSIMVSAPDVGGAAPVTMVRTVPSLARDYARLGHLVGIVDAVCAGDLDPDEASRRLKEREASGLEYRRWVRYAAAFAQGASICALLGGVLLEMVVAGLATFFIALLTVGQQQRRGSYFFTQVAAGAIPTVLAIALMYVRRFGVDQLWALSPSLVVASGMVSMLAGMGVVAAAQDALDGYFITAGARVVELLMRTGGLILGVAAVLWLGVRIGAPAYLAPEVTPAHHPVVQVLAAGCFAVALGVVSGLGPRGAVIVGGFGALGWTVHLLALGPVGGDYAIASAVAAMGIGLIAHLLAPRLGPPAIAIVTVAIAPLMPGMILYRALFRLVVGIPAVHPGDTAQELLMLAVMTGIALALGSSIGAAFGRRLALPTERVARLATLISLRRGHLRKE